MQVFSIRGERETSTIRYANPIPGPLISAGGYFGFKWVAGGALPFKW